MAVVKRSSLNRALTHVEMDQNLQEILNSHGSDFSLSGTTLNITSTRLASGGSTSVGLTTESIGVGTTASGTVGQIRATNQVIAYYSDEKLKDFEGPIDNALDKVSKLTGYYYRGNEVAKSLGYDTKLRQVGVSAQEVEKVLPEIVVPAPIDAKYKTLQYEKIVPLLIEAIKELNAKLDEK